MVAPVAAPLLAAGLILTACAVTTGNPPNDHVTAAFVGPEGIDKAREENLRAAWRTCHGGAVLIAEESGVNAGGAWVRLVYGCLAEDAAAP